MIFVIEKLYRLICIRESYDTTIDFSYFNFAKLLVSKNIDEI